MKPFWAALALAAALVCTPVLAAAETPVVHVLQAPAATQQVGDPFDVRAEVPAGGGRYLLTLTMVNQETGANVDLEGWIPGSAGQQVSGKPGETTVSWSGKAGAAGKFRVYVTAVPLDNPGTVTSSVPSELAVTPAPAPHADRLMTVAVAEPVVVAVAVGWILARRRRGAQSGREPE